MASVGVGVLGGCGSAPADRPAAPPAGYSGEGTAEEIELTRAERLLGLAPPAGEATSDGIEISPRRPAAPNVGGAPLATEPLATEPPACETACSALESMVRAADRICSLSPGDRCSRAQARVDRARTHVESTCGSCS